MSKSSKEELQVVIPYQRLVELLDSARGVDELRNTCKRQQDQIAALRLQFMELCEVLKELQNK